MDLVGVDFSAEVSEGGRAGAGDIASDAVCDLNIQTGWLRENSQAISSETYLSGTMASLELSPPVHARWGLVS